MNGRFPPEPDQPVHQLFLLHLIRREPLRINGTRFLLHARCPSCHPTNSVKTQRTNPQPVSWPHRFLIDHESLFYDNKRKGLNLPTGSPARGLNSAKSPLAFADEKSAKSCWFSVDECFLCWLYQHTPDSDSVTVVVTHPHYLRVNSGTKINPHAAQKKISLSIS